MAMGGAPDAQNRMSTIYGAPDGSIGEIGLAIGGDEFEGRTSPRPYWMQPQRIGSMTPIMDPAAATLTEGDHSPPSTESDEHPYNIPRQAAEDDGGSRAQPVLTGNWAGRGSRTSMRDGGIGDGSRPGPTFLD